ncbi:MAG: hypothetical protein LBU85_13090 [Treponema sp.]|jgi:hypothetical protein|nr:hypothetical protein [Treponema sp.]
MNIDTIIKEAQNLLLQNSKEWEPRFNGYAENLLANIRNKTHPLYARQFKEYPPLRFYISTSKIKKYDSPVFLDVRYRGQSVATLKTSSKGITISTRTIDKTNLRDFNCKIKLFNEDWRSPLASDFRSFFKNRPNSRNKTVDNKGNEEHYAESLLLTEFSKQSSTNKQLLNIQPVKLFGMKFSMPTPLSASHHSKPVKYTKSYRGAIDIFARTGKGGKDTYLTVIEVKIENDSKVTPQNALKQGIQYAVFIRELLRSEKGQDWYEIFGFSGKLPKKLKIRVACAMPDNFIDTSFANKKYSIGCDEIECHYIYFKYNGKKLFDFKSSLG